MKATYPLLTTVRRGSTYDVSASVSGLPSAAAGASASAELVRSFSGEPVGELAASVTVDGLGLVVSLDGDQLTPEATRPGEYYLRFLVQLAAGELLAVPADNTLALLLV